MTLTPDIRTNESLRLQASLNRTGNWKRWGPYLSERQWATVREDYSPWGECWDYFPHDHARSRAYRWGEDGLMGFTDRQCRLCFAIALWNGKDPILKERLFGLNGNEGNHGEDVKELYYYLDSSPTHSYVKSLYKYPQNAFPYDELVRVNRERSRTESEFELLDTGIFNESRYFDVTTEYAKADEDDILIRISVSNRGPEEAVLHLLPSLWFRNTWSFSQEHPPEEPKPNLERKGASQILAHHPTLGEFTLSIGQSPEKTHPEFLFTENETNYQRLFGTDNATPYVKDAFHEYLIAGNRSAVNPNECGTKGALHYALSVPAHQTQSIDLRLSKSSLKIAKPFGDRFNATILTRQRECEEYYSKILPPGMSEAERHISRQSYAGLLTSKQFYHYVVEDWLHGDKDSPAPPASRLTGRNHEWTHLYSRDVLSMPDKWEYPWFAAWDSAFHMLPFARVDGDFAKDQLILFLREWYMHPNGQMPAYEFAFEDVNPPVHAWSCWRVYKMTAQRGQRDLHFLKRVFMKLMMNFTWWVNRKDPEGKNIFAGGFLGLDNIGVFDRSKPLPTGGNLEQADGTAWMAFYCSTMLGMAMELATFDSSYEDIASKFFEHFIEITDAINCIGGGGLWDDNEGFYYDSLAVDGQTHPLRIRSMVGIIPMFAVEVMEQSQINALPGFNKRLDWFLEHRPELAAHISFLQHDPEVDGNPEHERRLLAIPSRERLERMLKYILDENEFLSDYGIRSLSKYHQSTPFRCNVGGEEHIADYAPAESTTGLFGGNSNWRGPVWFPLNFLLVESLERYHHFYGETFKVEFPTGSGNWMDLKSVSIEIATRLTKLFLPDDNGRRACHGDEDRYAGDPHWRDLVLFYEYFNGDNGRGCGASHQTGWTSLVSLLLEKVANSR
ncbi:MGH1-like glycoside hydrolase domain-containing protein [Planctomicrobium sp. SH668]|uniref:MGH1-like glycoside hydrolase domain-containing protein n=1 Tax=Planctomicrobium sp. SH668 TaxID=3448126 RepID=UPI003F5BB590